jgi:hypothetical protein
MREGPEGEGKARQLHDQGFSLSNFWEKSVTFPWAHEEYVVFFEMNRITFLKARS